MQCRRVVRAAGAMAIAAIAVAGCTRQAVPPATDTTPRASPIPPAAASPTEGGAMMKKDVVTLLGLRKKVLAGNPLEVTWQVKTEAEATITHTAVHYDSASHPGDFGTDVTPAVSGYPELTPDFAKGEFKVPRAFTAKLTPQAGTLYLRAHAIVGGKHEWTAEQAVVAVTDPKMLGDGDGAGSEAPGGAMKNNEVAPAVTRSFFITAKQWSFEPATLRVKKGQRVELVVKSVDVTHGLLIPDFNVDQKLEPGKTVTVEFTADKSGEFTFRCNVLCGTGHKDMQGKLIVE